jgi:hypothetical protein
VPVAVETIFLAVVLLVGISFVLGFPASLVWETRKVLRVEVRDAAGQPVAGATVWALTDHRQRPEVVVGALAWVDAPAGATRKPVGLTDAEGVWAGVLYWTNPWGLQVEAPGRPASQVAALRVDVEAGDEERVPFTVGG